MPTYASANRLTHRGRTHNNTFHITIMTLDEIENYDLSTTGTIVELTATASDELYGFQFESDGGGTVDLEVVIDGGTATDFTVFSTTSENRVDSGFVGPEVVDIRLRNTSTANDTADAILGSGGGSV